MCVLLVREIELIDGETELTDSFCNGMVFTEKEEFI
jgi:hypothetical protein